MLARRWIDVAVIAVLAACGVESQPSRGAAETEPDESSSAYFLSCPPWSDCTKSNGTGTYFAHGGHAGINTLLAETQLLITTFVNGGSSVQFRARYFDHLFGGWQWLTGTVDSAELGGNPGFDVLGVTESSTLPTWTLRDRLTAKIVTATGDELLALVLHVSFSAPALVHGTLSFDRSVQVPPMPPTLAMPPIEAYNLLWHDDASSGPSTQYCVDEAGKLDPVVFQQGIEVDPLTSRVTRDATTAGSVTMSCTRGAIVIAHQWGYPYTGLPGETFYYDAAIQMKRAVYCRDGESHTTAGTKIGITDNVVIHHERAID